ncbi:hypothetical protein [Candidatus Pseudoscillospira sp. SGI.172]|uniref:hypothetical protein n=1 Tax=Candidatus Pseudoscillospira sp. SGI.172 TaxID=3420582 RepID=UPI0009BAFAAD|nr:hypothetical protein [Pseudoflavonifractor sp.]MDY3020525.1 hypothetical protein [Oscillospiraceae bacterium]
MKRVLKIFALGIGIGVLSLLVQRAFQVPKDIFLHFYWIFGAVVIVGAIFFNFLYIRAYEKKMSSAAALLESGHPREYLAAVENLRRTARGRYLSTVFTVNLSAGYCDLHEYQTAIELLESLTDPRFYGVLKMVRRLNLCACYFYDRQVEKALALYQESLETFRPFRDRAPYGGNIAVLDVSAAIERGELDQAEVWLKTARGIWCSPRLQDDYQALEERIRHERGKNPV